MNRRPRPYVLTTHSVELRTARTAGAHRPGHLRAVDHHPPPDGAMLALLTALRKSLRDEAGLPSADTVRRTVAVVLSGPPLPWDHVDVDVHISTFRGYLMLLIPQAAQQGAEDLVTAVQALLNEQTAPTKRRETLVRLAGATRSLVDAVAPKDRT
ncbi:hypothetical protein ACIOEX_11070 [Streptomyces sp. NPDC087850]|uniref:hypothetical protein n=1 Tax=Streptomyces sp. NPDC087850 TaxID=3365809 RepID=UPI0037F7C5BD